VVQVAVVTPAVVETALPEQPEIGTELAVNATVPVGEAPLPATVAVRVTDWPTDGDVGEAVSAVVVAAGVTVMVRFVDADAAKFELVGVYAVLTVWLPMVRAEEENAQVAALDDTACAVQVG
jgi:hypothetical protein